MSKSKSGPLVSVLALVEPCLTGDLCVYSYGHTQLRKEKVFCVRKHSLIPCLDLITLNAVNSNAVFILNASKNLMTSV